MASGLPVWRCRCVDCGLAISDTPIETETIACGSTVEHQVARRPRYGAYRERPSPHPDLARPSWPARVDADRFGPWTNRFGVEVGVLTWQSTCQVCSAPFTATTSGKVTDGKQCAAFRVTACPEHRQRGKSAHD